MAFFVYILYSAAVDQYYVGHSADVDARTKLNFWTYNAGFSILLSFVIFA